MTDELHWEARVEEQGAHESKGAQISGGQVDSGGHGSRGALGADGSKRPRGLGGLCGLTPSDSFQLFTTLSS